MQQSEGVMIEDGAVEARPLPPKKKHRRGRRAGKRHPHPSKVAAKKAQEARERSNLTSLRQRLAAMRKS